jgi:hypothetical protein
MAGARERRHPATAVQARVPADVIDMQVRAHDDIDRLGREPRRPQVVEERGAQHVEGSATSAVLVVAHAGVDEHGEARRLHHERVDGLQEASRVVEEVRRQPAAVALDGLGHGLRQQPGGPRGARPLDDGADAQPSQFQGRHTAR